MATELLIPKLGMTMTEGTLAEWRVPDGAFVQPGEIVFHLETEKIEFDVEAETAGVVRHTVPAGTTLPPATVVGYILAPGEDLPADAASASLTIAPAAGAPAMPSAAQTATPAIGEGGRVLASPMARRLAAESGLDLAMIAGTGPGGRVTESDVEAAKRRPPVAPVSRDRLAVSPIARSLAEQLGVDLASVQGTGPGGRITKEDVEAASTTPSKAAPAPAASAAAPGEVVPLRGMRKVIAERMHASLQQMAQLTMAMEVEMDEAVKLRAALIDEWAPEGIRPGYTDLVIKAVARALRLHPRLNSMMTPDGIRLLSSIHIGMAVAVEDGLLVPVIRDADRAPLREVAAESSRLAALAREGKLGPDDVAGGTFSVTALGMAGIDFFTPVINPPNAAILGVGRIRDAVRWDGDRPLRCSQMTLSLTIDHRVVDGAPGAAFLQAIRDLLQSPYRLLL